MPKFGCDPETENKDVALILKVLEGQTRQEAGGISGRRQEAGGLTLIIIQSLI